MYIYSEVIHSCVERNKMGNVSEVAGHIKERRGSVFIVGP